MPSQLQSPEKPSGRTPMSFQMLTVSKSKSGKTRPDDLGRLLENTLVALEISANIPKIFVLQTGGKVCP